MRTLIIIIVVFCAVCLSLVLNYNYINNTADELLSLTSSLDISDRARCAETLVEIERLWKKSSVIFSLTVSFLDIDHLDEVFLSLRESFEANNASEFERQRALFEDAIEGVARLEKFSLMNIL